MPWNISWNMDFFGVWSWKCSELFYRYYFSLQTCLFTQHSERAFHFVATTVAYLYFLHSVQYLLRPIQSCWKSFTFCFASKDSKDFASNLIKQMNELQFSLKSARNLLLNEASLMQWFYYTRFFISNLIFRLSPYLLRIIHNFNPQVA